MRRSVILSLALLLLGAEATRADLATPFGLGGRARMRRTVIPFDNAVALRVQTGTDRARLIVPRGALRRAKQMAGGPAGPLVLCAAVPLLAVGVIRRPRLAIGLLVLLTVLVQANPVVPNTPPPRAWVNPEDKPVPVRPQALLQVDQMTLEVVEEGYGIHIVLPSASAARLAER
jgi:hypothetical protein